MRGRFTSRGVVAPEGLHCASRRTISTALVTISRVVAAGFVALSPVAVATPPANMTPDPALSAWFEALRQPGTQHLCCSISDCRVTVFNIREGHYEIRIDGWPYIVPDADILHQADNPTGQAVVCYAYSSFGIPIEAGQPRTKPQDTVEILCFIPPKQITSDTVQNPGLLTRGGLRKGLRLYSQ